MNFLSYSSRRLPFRLPRPDYIQCHHNALPLFPKVAHRSPQSWPPHVTNLAFLALPAYSPQYLRLPLFCPGTAYDVGLGYVLTKQSMWPCRGLKRRHRFVPRYTASSLWVRWIKYPPFCVSRAFIYLFLWVKSEAHCVVGTGLVLSALTELSFSMWMTPAESINKGPR